MAHSKILIRHYKTDKQYQSDAQKLSRQGWRVANVTQEVRNSGCFRGCLLGLMALVWKPKSVLTVTYERD